MQRPYLLCLKKGTVSRFNRRKFGFIGARKSVIYARIANTYCGPVMNNLSNREIEKLFYCYKLRALSMQTPNFSSR